MRVLAVVALVLKLAAADCAYAQDPAPGIPRSDHAAAVPSPRSLPGRFLADLRQLPTKEPLIIIAAGGALAAAAAPSDRRTSRLLSSDRTVEESLDAGATAGNGYVQVGSAAAIYAIGGLTHAPRVAVFGAELLEAQAVSGVLTTAVKVSVGRRRPDGGRNSFPSGHASATFATAGVIAQRYGWRPGLLAFAGAAYVGASRISDRQHYASDVIFGASLGLASARAVHRAEVRRTGAARLTLMAVPARHDLLVLGAYSVGPS